MAARTRWLPRGLHVRRDNAGPPPPAQDRDGLGGTIKDGPWRYLRDSRMRGARAAERALDRRKSPVIASRRWLSLELRTLCARSRPYDTAVAAMRKGKARTPRTLSVSRCALIAQAGPAPPEDDISWRIAPAENPHCKAKAWRRASSTPTACGVAKLRSDCSMAAPWQMLFVSEESVQMRLPQSFRFAREMIRKVMQRCGNIAYEIRLSCQWVSSRLGGFAVGLVISAIRRAHHVPVQQRSARKQPARHFEVKPLGVAPADIFNDL